MVHRSFCSFETTFLRRKKEQVVKAFLFDILDVRL